MMRRRAFVAGMAAVIVVVGNGSAQQAGEHKKIGYLYPWSPPAPADPARARHVTHGDVMREELARQGWIEGRNLTVERRYARGRTELLPQLVAEVLDAKVNVLLAPSTTSALVAKRATATVPIVVVGAELVQFEVVSNVARPDGNVTGQTLPSIALIGKRLQLLRELLPRARRVAVLGCGTEESRGLSGPPWEVADAAAAAVNVELMRYAPQTPDDVRAALGDASKRRADGLLVFDCPAFQRTIDKSIFVNHELPGMYYLEIFVHAGRLMSYAVDETLLWRRAAWYIGRILNGAKPEDLPVEEPHHRLVVNGKAARTLGVTVSPSLLLRADQVIE